MWQDMAGVFLVGKSVSARTGQDERERRVAERREITGNPVAKNYLGREGRASRARRASSKQSRVFFEQGSQAGMPCKRREPRIMEP
jgi:hypothetical protein